MRVHLALQVFSNSVAKGFEFYRSYQVPGLEDCGSTIQFCLKLNEMFDALNRKFPIEGVTLSSNDFQVLVDSKVWLDSWERACISGEIPSDRFLTASTVEGLRVTLKSAVELTQFLIEKCNFKYVLTGKLNQDSLERFFGTIRSAAGSNDHPATPTFLQLYKLLSLYSILKPPKAGNCTPENDKPLKPLIGVTDLKEIFSKPSDNKIQAIEDLKEKLDNIIEYEDWEFDDVFEHYYAAAPIVDCVIYYVTRYLCKQFRKYTKCEKCRSSFTSPVTVSQLSVARLVNLKTRGGLIHPNEKLFSLVKKIETLFEKYNEDPYVFEKIVDELPSSTTFSFPCRDHAVDMISYIVRYYVSMRMRQYTAQLNVIQEKMNSYKKKIARFTVT